MCVAKVGERGRPAPAFWLRVHPPLARDPALAADLWRASARRHGLPVAAADALVARGQAWAAELASRAVDRPGADLRRAPPPWRAAADRRRDRRPSRRRGGRGRSRPAPSAAARRRAAAAARRARPGRRPTRRPRRSGRPPAPSPSHRTMEDER